MANQLLRFFRVEADLLRVLGGWTARVTENDERLALARDVGRRAERGDAIRTRLGRLRTTERMVHVPSPEWRALVELVDEAPSTADLVAAVYGVIGKALVDAYELLWSECDPLADEPTIRLVTRHLLPDHEEGNAWAAAFLDGKALDANYQRAVTAALDGAGGLVVRSDEVPGDRTDDGATNGTGFWPLPRTSPEGIELGSEYRIAQDGERVSYCPGFEAFGPRDVEVLVVHHGLMPEIASLCIVGCVVHEVSDRPWSFYRDFATQCADEVRHIGLLLRRLEQLGEGAGAHPFPTWTFYDAVAWLPAPERTLVFNAIVEGNVVETLHDRVRALQAAGNPETAYLMDWISADESLHLRNGMDWLRDTAAAPADVDRLLDRGQALLGTVMKRKDATNRVFDSASEDLADGRFYAPRKNPVAPIARELGGFRPDQIDRLIESADGRTVRL
ncbi:MAG TPA: ferritin-like domain-containing protein [Acidimicrobiales bacterium]|nr:ferritin-like domain-containing protein [Acidimicrobiales bacterium]